MFQKAQKSKSKLRLTIDGPAGAGKTYSSLQLATALGKKIALIDTEHASASKYADIFSFDTANLTDHSPLSYVEAIKAAGEAGYEVLVVDSLSHAWTASLEIVDREKDKFGSGWRKVTPMHQKLVEAILSYPGHIICTMRSKMAYESEKDANGRVTIRKVGMAPVMREGMEYEFDVVIDVSLEGNVNISKTRCSALTDKLFTRRDIPMVAKILNAWLNDGAVAPAPVPAFEAAKAKVEQHLGLAAIANQPGELRQIDPNSQAIVTIVTDEPMSTFDRIANCVSEEELKTLYRSLPPEEAKRPEVLAAFKAQKAAVR